MKKIFFTILISFMLVAFFHSSNTYAGWNPSFLGWYYTKDDGTVYKNGWYLIDDNKDGIGELYYFNADGFLLTDTICPDYSIVDKSGRKLDLQGNIITENAYEPNSDGEGYYVDAQEYVRETEAGALSEGSIRADKIGVSEKPDVLADAGTLLMKGVKLKEDPTDTASRKLVDHIVGGDKYDKNASGKVTGNVKWTNVLKLNGNEAYVIFNNPGFSEIRGKVAHEYKSSTDETHCSIVLSIDDLEFSTIEDFDFKKAESFQFELPEECMKIKLELIVTGEHTGRAVYIRDLFYRK